MNPFAAIRDALAHVHPDAPWVVLTAGIWLVQYLLRRFQPKVWSMLFSWVPEDTNAMVWTMLHALPSVVMGAALPAFASGMNLRAAVTGAVFGALAPIWHHVLRAVPGPYEGALKALGASATVTPKDG